MLQPTVIDQPNLQQVSQVDSVLVSVGRQLDLDQCPQGQHSVLPGCLRLRDRGVRQEFPWPDHLAGKDQVDPVAGFATGAVQEQIDTGHMAVLEAGGGQCRPDRVEVGPPHEQIDVARVADGRDVDPGNPQGDGVSPGDGIGNASRLKGGGRARQALAD